MIAARARMNKLPLVLAGAIAMLTAAVFAPLTDYASINFDDPDVIFKNPAVLQGLTGEAVAWAFSTLHAGNWVPLTWLSHMLDVELFGVDPGGHHLMNVLLHGAGALVLFFLVRSMTGALWRSFLVAALFAIHPLHVESVAWITLRRDLLSALFLFLTVWAYCLYTQAPRWPRYATVMACFALSLSAKPTAVPLPAALLFLDHWPLGRTPVSLRGAKGAEPSPLPAGWLRLLAEKVPLLALAGTVTIVTYHAQSAAGAIAERGSLTLSDRLATTFVSYAGYIGKTLWPRGLAVFYPYQSLRLPLWMVLAAAALFILATAAAVRTWRSRPYLVTGWGWYVTMLLPVIGLAIKTGLHGMADRYTYVPLVGLFFILAWGLADLARAHPVSKKGLAGLAAFALAALTVTARAQVGHWEDSVTLFRHTLEVTSPNPFAHQKMGEALREDGPARRGEAVFHFREVLKMWPYFPESHFELANLLRDEGRIEEAILHYRMALESKENYVEAHQNLGVLLVGREEAEEAASHFLAILAIDPAHTGAHYNMGLVLARQGRAGEAMTHYRRAIELEPDYAEAHNNLAILLLEEGQLTAAEGHFLRAVEISPGYVEARYNLGTALVKAGRAAEAATQYEEVLRRRPDFLPARISLDAVRSMQRQAQDR